MQQKYRLTPNQAKLYRHYKSYPNDTSYNLAFLYKITGDLDVIRLKTAIEIVCNAIDLLKVNFIEEENEIIQSYSDERKYEVEILHRKSSETKESFYNKVSELIFSLENTPINLAKWPLLEFFLYLSSNDECYLSLITPHILADGHSYYLLIDRINYCYNSLLPKNVLESLAHDFFKDKFLGKDYSVSDTHRDDVFFQQELLALDSLELKTIKQERNQRGVLEGIVHEFVIPKPKINEFLSKHRCSENSFFLAIHGLFLKKITDETLIIIGLPLLNRNKSNRNVFGYFANTLPLIIDFSKIGSFQSLIDSINKKMLRLLRHQSFDLSLLSNIDSCFSNYFTYHHREFNFAIDKCCFNQICLENKAIFTEFTCSVENTEENYMFFVETGDYFKSVNIEKVINSIIDNIIQLDNSTVEDLTNQESTC